MTVEATLRVTHHPTTVGDEGTAFPGFIEYRLTRAVSANLPFASPWVSCSVMGDERRPSSRQSTECRKGSEPCNQISQRQPYQRRCP